jgi:hypothetical protein
MTSNGSRLAAYQEEVADPRYRPSIIDNDPASTPPDVHIAAKGAPFTEIFTVWGWHRLTFFSFTGVYGYMTIFGPKAYYTFMALIYLVFASYTALALLRSRDRRAMLQLSIAAGCAALCILSSAYLSWTYAFQAQGRYLFPILPMGAVLIAVNRKYFSNYLFYSVWVAAFLGSVYSFVFVGLSRINEP